jgi:hypothetical protein
MKKCVEKLPCWEKSLLVHYERIIGREKGETNHDGNR